MMAEVHGFWFEFEKNGVGLSDEWRISVWRADGGT
jgi:hypothetical protein